MNILTAAFPVITILYLLFFFLYYKKASSPRAGTLEWIEMVEKPAFAFNHRRYPMRKKDYIAMTVLTLIYAVVAFWGLGDNTAPQTFYRFEAEDSAILLELEDETDIGEIMYYTGLWKGSYSIEFSSDGVYWTGQTTLEQAHSDLFKWLYATLDGSPEAARYIRITSDTGPIELGELAIYDTAGGLISPDRISYPAGASALFDEQDIIPGAPSYMNSSYFDEIYHARTAYENTQNIYPYETSHPPLGKLIISIGIELFGMTPFGYRFMGTLFGVVMLTFLYIFIKNMFGKTVIAVCGTALFAFDFMHYVQTRIATIDTYSAFFVILMYLFMYRYITQDYNTPFRKTLLPLFLCGLSFGLGAASKWTSIYAGAGLAVLYLIHLILRGRYHHKNGSAGEFTGHLIKTLSVSILFFIVVPCVIYYLSYIPYGLAGGMSLKDGMLFDREYFNIVWDNQKFMFSYHSGVDSEHPYSSRWYQWILNIRPILYYRSEVSEGVKSSFSSFGNPIVWWGGLMALLSLFKSLWKRPDGRALFIIIGYCSQLAPWLFISRTTFVYHYFTSTIFLVLALCYILNHIWERGYGGYKLAVYSFTAISVLLFAAFYPVLSGIPTSSWYTYNFLRWVPSWPFS